MSIAPPVTPSDTDEWEPSDAETDAQTPRLDEPMEPDGRRACVEPTNRIAAYMLTVLAVVGSNREHRKPRQAHRNAIYITY